MTLQGVLVPWLLSPIPLIPFLPAWPFCMAPYLLDGQRLKYGSGIANFHDKKVVLKWKAVTLENAVENAIDSWMFHLH